MKSHIKNLALGGKTQGQMEEAQKTERSNY